MEDMVGKPLVYSTSKSFMDYLGINSLDDLPKLNEIIQIEMPLPTPASDAEPETLTALAVTEQGELVEIRADHQEQDSVKG